MNWDHFSLLLWLRYRLTANSIRRQGLIVLFATAILLGLGLLLSFCLGVTAVVTGHLLVQRLSPHHLLYVWDGAAVAFLFMWMIGLLTELQRGELFSIDRFMHLPTRLREIFALNFLNSLITLTTLALVPSMLGFAVAQVVQLGPKMLVAFPLIIMFVLMVSALTYQFRGWMASLITDKRRQRAVMGGIMITVILLAQLPNLAQLYLGFGFGIGDGLERQWEGEQKKQLALDVAAKKMSADEQKKREDEIKAERVKRYRERMTKTGDQINYILGWTNHVLPIGWMPLGISRAAAGDLLPAAWGFLGMSAITFLSLRRSYRTTLRYFQGQIGERASSNPANTKPGWIDRFGNLLERDLIWSPEPVAAVFWSTTVNLLRAPEVRMLLISPIAMILVCVMVISSSKMGAEYRSMTTIAMMSFSLVGAIGIVFNLFGFDRSAFRSYVLSSVPRYQILLGKNLAMVPLFVFFVIFPMLVLQLVMPGPFSHFVAGLFLSGSLFAACCLMGNMCSIYAPIAIQPGTFKPSANKALPILIQAAFVMVLMCIIVPLAMLPFGIEMLVKYLYHIDHIPIAMIGCAIGFVVSLILYWLFIRAQGRSMQYREQLILEAVTDKAE